MLAVMFIRQDPRVTAYVLKSMGSDAYVYRGKSGLACGRKSRAGFSEGSTCNPRDPREVIPGEFPPVFGQPIIDPSSMFDVGAIVEDEDTIFKGGKTGDNHAKLVEAMAARFKRTGVRPEFFPQTKLANDGGYWLRKPGALYVDTTGNEKVVGEKDDRKGIADVTYASISRSCPSSCTLRDNGCYAQFGKVAMTVTRLDREAKAFHMNAADVANAEGYAILESHLDSKGRPQIISDSRVLRLHVSGDASTAQAASILSRAVAGWYQRSRGSLAQRGFLEIDEDFVKQFGPRKVIEGTRRCWSYTHAWREVPRSAWTGVSVLASIDDISQGAAALQRGYAPAVVVASFDDPVTGKRSERAITDPSGKVRFIKCPAQTKEKFSCVQCMLCFRSDFLVKTGQGIAFEAHGAGKRRLPMVKK